MGDHGWQLGEMDEWRKMTNWELGVRVPLIIRAPWVATGHAVSDALVEAVDLYPTFAELAGLPPPGSGANGYPVQHLEGRSIVPNLVNASAPGGQYAFSRECWGGSSMFYFITTRESPSPRCVSLAVTTNQSSICVLATNRVQATISCFYILDES